MRPYEATDWPALWALMEPVFRGGNLPPRPSHHRGPGPDGVGGAEAGGDGGRGRPVMIQEMVQACWRRSRSREEASSCRPGGTRISRGRIADRQRDWHHQ
jgi:hypothetical protein